MTDFIVIDDDNMNNIICFNIIKQTIKGAVVNTFTEPEKGLEYILSGYSDENSSDAVLFLDINMPSLSGWEVLDKFKDFPESIKKRIKIHMLSSSVNPLDKRKAQDNPYVSSYVEKSLSKIKLLTISNSLVLQ